MFCKNGHPMEIESVETVPAHQGFSQDGSGIVDATHEDMWWCDICQESEPIDHDQGDTSDEARDSD